MKRTAILLAAVASAMLLSCLTLQAGEQPEEGRTISGKVIDSGTSLPLEFVTVALIVSDSTYINGTVTDSEGHFSVNCPGNGQYRIALSLIGYKDLMMEIDGTSGHDIGTVTLEPDAMTLDAAVITARRPVIEQKLDKIVMNVADAVSTEGSNGSGLLRKAPGVTIDFDGNVKLNGSTVAVW
ncbi:MAG TPA: carboxypeptidase-like regulatory domain-containing protein, partial [Candidatus Coprenecus stercoravium]|nr:carboxypeptidase-like regulatory domain-containing protein [Candidatus Coprenecus stercoravium]